VAGVGAITVAGRVNSGGIVGAGVGAMVGTGLGVGVAAGEVNIIWIVWIGVELNLLLESFA